MYGTHVADCWHIGIVEAAVQEDGDPEEKQQDTKQDGRLQDSAADPEDQQRGHILGPKQEGAGAARHGTGRRRQQARIQGGKEWLVGGTCWATNASL